MTEAETWVLPSDEWNPGFHEQHQPCHSIVTELHEGADRGRCCVEFGHSVFVDYFPVSAVVGEKRGSLKLESL